MCPIKLKPVERKQTIFFDSKYLFSRLLTLPAGAAAPLASPLATPKRSCNIKLYKT